MRSTLIPTLCSLHEGEGAGTQSQGPPSQHDVQGAQKRSSLCVEKVLRPEDLSIIMKPIISAAAQWSFPFGFTAVNTTVLCVICSVLKSSSIETAE